MEGLAQTHGYSDLGGFEPYISELCVVDKTGDTRLMWDKSKAGEVAHAEKRFNELKALRYLAYKVKKDGTQGEVLQKFDPSAERIIMTPPMVGG